MKKNYFNVVGCDPETDRQIGESVFEEDGVKKKKLFFLNGEIGLNEIEFIDGMETENLKFDLFGHYSSQFCDCCGERLIDGSCSSGCRD